MIKKKKKKSLTRMQRIPKVRILPLRCFTCFFNLGQHWILSKIWASLICYEAEAFAANLEPWPWFNCSTGLDSPDCSSEWPTRLTEGRIVLSWLHLEAFKQLVWRGSWLEWWYISGYSYFKSLFWPDLIWILVVIFFSWCQTVCRHTGNFLCCFFPSSRQSWFCS
jgi:hypothetical protein